MSARALLRTICAEFHEFTPPGTPDQAGGPLGWPGYDDQRSRARERTGEQEAVICGRGAVGTAEAVLIAFEFGFLGGSVGQATGARIVAAFEKARELSIPVVSLVASGGSRVQEGICALSQLQAIAAACAAARRAGIAHVTVLRHPVAGGMWAALAASADVVLATPEAPVAFGGSRVRAPEQQGVAFTAEGKLATGQADRIVPEDELAAVLGNLLPMLMPARPVEPADVPDALTITELPSTGWEAVSRARSPLRRRAKDYLDDYFTDRFELSGDRAGGVDAGMRCGFGIRNGRAIAFAAQAGTANTAAGFRTAARVIRIADQLGIPVLTLVDTPGAANDAGAEQHAIGPAISEVFAAVATAEVPVTTLVIGEGGSGGALALASPGRTWITPEAYFAVISPEASVAILKRDLADAAQLADQLMLRPQDLLELGFVAGIALPSA